MIQASGRTVHGERWWRRISKASKLGRRAEISSKWSKPGKERWGKNIQARNGWVIQKHPSTECEKHFKMIQARERNLFNMIQARKRRIKMIQAWGRDRFKSIQARGENRDGKAFQNDPSLWKDGVWGEMMGGANQKHPSHEVGLFKMIQAMREDASVWNQRHPSKMIQARGEMREIKKTQIREDSYLSWENSKWSKPTWTSSRS